MKKIALFGVTALALLSLAACGSSNSTSSASKVSKSSLSKSSTKKLSSSSSTSKSSEKPKVSSSSKTTPTASVNAGTILTQLISYTNSKSPGPTKNYYWENGTAQLSGFETMKAGDYHFSADTQGRSGIARAVLTYSEYQNSKGSRQGSPLDPPAWPSNSMVAITFSLTGKTYHGYLYNRSHSIADSLLGKYSYTSQYNFTTGTRSQNVGADQNGGMRAAEELAENYWASHPNTTATIDYDTTPIYSGNETVPRGSIVDEKSSDGSLNTEIVVINDAEGITINYNSGSESSNTPASTTANKPKTTAPPAPPSSSAVSNSPTTTDGWMTAASGMVFAKESSGKYYSMVTNPNNYTYMSQSAADAAGYVQASRGNEYAKP